MAAVASPLHNTWLFGCATPGVGLTVIVNVFDAPRQLLAVGVTVIVAVIGVVVLLVAVNAAIFPVPLAAKPMDGSLFVQL